MIPSYLHPLERGAEELPAAFTFPFRYTPHPLCVRAATLVQQELRALDVTEGKMYGVLIARPNASHEGEDNTEAPLFFLAAYSGQLNGSYNHPWFVPPVVDYLASDSYFQQEQQEIVALGARMEAMRESEERRSWQQQVTVLQQEREAAIAEAKRVYAEGKSTTGSPDYIRLRQFQKANIHRAKQLHKEELAVLETKLAEHNAAIRQLHEERRQRSEALQQWLFRQFDFLNGKGENKNLLEIFGNARFIPSGAGECCAPKLLQTAYLLGLQPLAMAEFWWGTSNPGHYREPGAFFPACRSKCHPILGHMIQGLRVEPDPAEHYDNKVLAPVRVVWEDEHLAVIEKPEGWCSIPGKSDQPNLLDEAYRLWPDIQGSVVVHRLDQDTSGLMVLAKTPQIHRALSQQFEQREVKKRYVALLEKAVLRKGAAEEGSLSLPLAPDLENMPRRRVDLEAGKTAVTDYKVLGTETYGGRDVTRVAFYPQTGRTHQLRVHSASPQGLNAPILGDRLYGHVADRLYLHAESLEFTHPVTHERMHFTVPAPF